MIVDDSIVARSVFQTILSPLPEFEIVATASTPSRRWRGSIGATVDIVLLDLAMPGMDGFTALPEIVRRGRGARVLIVSASAGAGAEACVRAMTLGAADTLEKPVAGSFGGQFQADLIDKLRRIGGDTRVPDRDAVREVAPAVLACDTLATRALCRAGSTASRSAPRRAGSTRFPRCSRRCRRRATCRS